MSTYEIFSEAFQTVSAHEDKVKLFPHTPIYKYSEIIAAELARQPIYLNDNWAKTVISREDVI